MKKCKHTPKHAGDVSKSLKKAAYSYISLFLIIMVLVGTTVSWFTVQDTATLKSGVMVFNSGSGLRVNDGEDITNHITIKDFTLDETSSVDGRNIFLPNGNLKAGTTGEMLYREATAGDKNKKFMYADFKLKGESAGEIPVYIKSYSVTIGDKVYDGSTEITYSDNKKLKPEQINTHPKCPLRIAFIEDSEDDPKVIDPSVLVDKYTWTYQAIASTDNNGNGTTDNSTANSFSHYYFANQTAGEPLFTLNGSTAINATIVAWLEGSDDELGYNVSSEYENQKISIDIELESNFEDMETITFVDDTSGDTDTSVKKWIGGGDCLITMTYTDVTTNIDGDGSKHPVRTVVMNPSEYKTVDGKQQAIKWTAPIPKSVVTDITFNRYHYTKDADTKTHKCKEEIYNAWYTNSRVMDMWEAVYVDGVHPVVQLETGKDLQVSRNFNGVNSTVYTAYRGNGYGTTDNPAQRLSPCIGYWTVPATPTTSTTKATGATEASTTSATEPAKLNVSVYLNISDTKQWIRDDLTKYNYVMCVVFSDGSIVAMNRNTNGDRCTLEGYEIASSVEVTGFRAINQNDSTFKEYKADKNFKFNSHKTTVTFEVTDDDTVKATS